MTLYYSKFANNDHGITCLLLNRVYSCSARKTFKTRCKFEWMLRMWVKTRINSPSLTLWLVLDEFLHLALFERVDHVGQTALASLRGAQSWSGAGFAPRPHGPLLLLLLLLTGWGRRVVLGVGAQGQAFTAILILTKRRRERQGVKQSDKQPFANYFVLFLSVEACLDLLSSSSAHLYCRKSLFLSLPLSVWSLFRQNH